MPRLSVTIITLDEQENIERAIRSVDFADEVLVVDSGSRDRTCDIARELGAKVLFNQWPGHVLQKQFAVDQAAHDWILSIDADEKVSPELREMIIAEMAAESPRVDAFEVHRRTWYLNRWIRYAGWYPDKRIRLFDRRKAHWGGYDPHDWVECDGKTALLAADLQHFPYKDIADHMKTIDNYTTIMSDRLYEKGKRSGVADVIFRPPYTFFKKFFLQKGLLDGFAGFVVSVSSAVSVYFKYLKLWEKRAIKGGR